MNGTETIAEAGPYSYTSPHDGNAHMTATLIGYARCSTDRQGPAAQRQALLELGIVEDRIYTDHGLTGTTRTRPGLDQALYDLGDPMGKLFFHILATFAEFEADLIRMRTREGMAIARARGKCAASSPNCPTAAGTLPHACPRASIPSAISPNPAPSQDQPSIAHSTDATPLSVRSCPLPESTRTSRWRRRCAPAWSRSPASPTGRLQRHLGVAFGSQRPFPPSVPHTLYRI